MAARSVGHKRNRKPSLSVPAANNHKKQPSTMAMESSRSQVVHGELEPLEVPSDLDKKEGEMWRLLERAGEEFMDEGRRLRDEAMGFNEKGMQYMEQAKEALDEGMELRKEARRLRDEGMQCREEVKAYMEKAKAYMEKGQVFREEAMELRKEAMELLEKHNEGRGGGTRCREE